MIRLWKAYILSAITLLVLSNCSDNESTEPIPDYFSDGLAEGVNYGIAVNYKSDIGLENNEFVIVCDNFDNGQVNIPTEYDRYIESVTVTADGAYDGGFGAEHSWTEGKYGQTCRFILPESAHNEKRNAYFVRMYFNYDESFHPGEGMQAIGVKGFGIYCEQGPSGTNTPCDGTNWYNASCQFTGWGPSVKADANDGYLWFGHLYSYNPDPERAISEVGTISVSDPQSGQVPYRFSIYSQPYKYLKFNQWYCYEVGLYLNTPGKNDGEIRFWIDGVLQSRATNMRFRDIEDLYPDNVQLNLYRTTPNFPQTMKRYCDNIVVAKRYIGPMVK